MFFKTKYKNAMIPIMKRITKTRSLGILNRFLNGVIMIKANPITLLIKNRG